MLFVRRTAEPAYFQSRAFIKARSAARAFYHRARRQRLQERHEFDASLFARAFADVHRLFCGKCAYCEAPVQRKSGIDHFRPIYEITERHAAQEEGYWWLAYEWSNMYLVCDYCRRNRRNAFPILGKRGMPGEKGRRLRERERPLLLDPCIDQPQDFLTFLEDGTIAPIEHHADSSPKDALISRQRAIATIGTLGLNRPDLVSARAEVVSEFRELLTVAAHRQISPVIIKRIGQFLDPRRPFAGFRLGIFVARWEQIIGHLAPERRRKLLATLPIALRLTLRASRARHRALGRPTRAGKRLPSLPTSLGSIVSVQLENFKAIRELELPFPITTENGLGWKVLLGENGTGKSSILQAIAIALMGPSATRGYLSFRGVGPSHLLRKYRGSRTTSSGRIRVDFSSGARAEVTITPRKIEFLSRLPSRVFLCGYGATRLSGSRHRYRLSSSVLPPGVRNLFDATAPVLDVNQWLVGLSRKQKFASAALSLKDLLQLPRTARFATRRGRAVVPLNTLAHTLDELSAGFESVIAMASGIIAGLLGTGTTRDLRQASGVVLIDEVDAHLHPRWKMRIVEDLRRAFPTLQFVVTTHEPLCLRGVRKGETVVLERIGREVTAFHDLPDPSTMRVEQLLTSNLFGLRSTLDPETDRRLQRYYQLLEKPEDQLSTHEKKECEALSEQIGGYENRLMTRDPREELLYEAIDQYLASDVSWRGAQREALPELREQTKARLVEIYRNIPTQRQPVR